MEPRVSVTMYAPSKPASKCHTQDSKPALFDSVPVHLPGRWGTLAGKLGFSLALPLQLCVLGLLLGGGKCFLSNSSVDIHGRVLVKI